MGKKLSGIAFGQRTKQKGQSDTAQLIKLRNFIKQRFDMDFKRNWYVGFDKEYGYVTRIVDKVTKKQRKQFEWREPDLLRVDRKYGLIIIELDGSVHDHKTERTEKRNKLFRGAGIKLIVINIANAKEIGKTIEKVCECEMMKLIGSGCDG